VALVSDGIVCVAQAEGILVAVDVRLLEHAHQWRRKPALREIYTDLHRRMAAACVSGTTLEIGGGSGAFKDFLPDVLSSDILFMPGLDLVADAHRLPFSSASFSNIILFDVLHHLEFPRTFLAEAVRVLRVGGRLIMVEPAITPLSWFFYHFIHHEPVRMAADPLASGVPSPGRDAFDGNQAIPTLLVGRDRHRLMAEFPEFVIKEVQWLSLFAYPLSGGFKPWSLIPRSWVAPTLRLEELLRPVLGRMMAFRIFIVLERQR
jgi:SAM-dependent methyltransferase